MVATRIPGDDVRSMVRQGARKRMCFGFCQDKQNDPLLMIEPGKKPEALKAPLKKAGGGPPMLWGTYVVRSDQMEMICEQVSSRMITQLKKFLRSNRAKVNVAFYDKGGNLLDSLKPEQAQSVVSEEHVSDIQAPAGQDRAVGELLRRLKRIRPRIALAPGPLERKLKRALAKTVGLINAGSLAEAEALITTIETLLAKLGKTQENPDRTARRAQRSRDSHGLAASVKRVQTLRSRASATPGPARSKLDIALQKVARKLKARDLGGADKMMDRIEKALATLI